MYIFKQEAGKMKKGLLVLCLALIHVIAAVATAGCLQVKSKLPAINSFNAAPSSITAGASSTISWNVSGATGISIDQGIGEVALTGNRALLPAATTIYTLKATNPAGSVTATTQVIVTAASAPVPSAGSPVINSFTASPGTITAGNSSTLSWNVSNAVSVTIDQGIGAVAASASQSVYPGASTIYTLTASNASGSFSSTAQVTVTGAYTGPQEPPPSPAPAPAPAPSFVFAVTGASASVDPLSFAGACPKSYTCSAVITANGPGIVTYRWERSDGGSSPLQTVSFAVAGSQAVTTGWSRNATGNHWVKVRTVSPNEVLSNQANFTLDCEVAANPLPAGDPVVTDVIVSTDQQLYRGDCPVSLTCIVDITIEGGRFNGGQNVTYVWERSDGGTSPVQTVRFDRAGTKRITTGWSRDTQGRHWVAVRTLTPNVKLSNKSFFGVTCGEPLVFELAP
jgi:hypothetical protein